MTVFWGVITASANSKWSLINKYLSSKLDLVSFISKDHLSWTFWYNSNVFCFILPLELHSLCFFFATKSIMSVTTGYISLKTSSLRVVSFKLANHIRAPETRLSWRMRSRFIVKFHFLNGHLLCFTYICRLHCVLLFTLSTLYYIFTYISLMVIYWL